VSPQEMRCEKQLLNRQAILDYDEDYFQNEIVDATFRSDAIRISVHQKSITTESQSFSKKLEVYSSITASTDDNRDSIETVDGFWSIETDQ